jgi:hypothetical protein
LTIPACKRITPATVKNKVKYSKNDITDRHMLLHVYFGEDIEEQVTCGAAKIKEE